MIDDLAKLAGQLNSPSGVILILLLNVVVLAVGAFRGWWYSGRAYEALGVSWSTRYEEIKEERNNWRTIALGSIRLGHKAVGVAEDSLGIEKK